MSKIIDYFGCEYYLTKNSFDVMDSVKPVHVEEVFQYLTKKQYKIKIYKMLGKSEYIIRYRNVTIEATTAREAIEILLPIYQENKRKDVKQIWEDRLRRLQKIDRLHERLNEEEKTEEERTKNEKQVLIGET